MLTSKVKHLLAYRLIFLFNIWKVWLFQSTLKGRGSIPMCFVAMKKVWSAFLAFLFLDYVYFSYATYFAEFVARNRCGREPSGFAGQDVGAHATQREECVGFRSDHPDQVNPFKINAWDRCRTKLNVKVFEIFMPRLILENDLCSTDKANTIWGAINVKGTCLLYRADPQSNFKAVE